MLFIFQYLLTARPVSCFIPSPSIVGRVSSSLTYPRIIFAIIFFLAFKLRVFASLWSFKHPFFCSAVDAFVILLFSLAASFIHLLRIASIFNLLFLKVILSVAFDFLINLDLESSPHASALTFSLFKLTKLLHPSLSFEALILLTMSFY